MGLVQSTWHAENNINNATIAMASSESETVPHSEFLSAAECPIASHLPFPSCLHKSFQPAISYSRRVAGVHARHTCVHTPAFVWCPI